MNVFLLKATSIQCRGPACVETLWPIWPFNLLTHWLCWPLAVFNCVCGTGPAYFNHVCVSVVNISGRVYLHLAERHDWLSNLTGWATWLAEQPDWLSDMIGWATWLAERHDMFVPQTKTRLGWWSFHIAVPAVWKSLRTQQFQSSGSHFGHSCTQPSSVVDSLGTDWKLTSPHSSSSRSSRLFSSTDSIPHVWFLWEHTFEEHGLFIISYCVIDV